MMWCEIQSACPWPEPFNKCIHINSGVSSVTLSIFAWFNQNDLTVPSMTEQRSHLKRILT